MQSRRIPDESITASSAKSDDHAPWFARIDDDNAWCSTPEDESPYIEILLEEQQLITAITTQGSFFDFSWARKYEIKYLEKGKWKPYKEVWTNFIKYNNPFSLHSSLYLFSFLFFHHRNLQATGTVVRWTETSLILQSRHRRYESIQRNRFHWCWIPPIQFLLVLD